MCEASLECTKLKSKYSISSSRLYQWDSHMSNRVGPADKKTPFPISLSLAFLHHARSYRSHAAVQWLKNDEACSKVYAIEHSINAPSSKFFAIDPVPCNKDRAINQAKIADTRHWLMKWGTLELMTNGSLRYGHSILWQSAENTWPLAKSWTTFCQHCAMQK